MKIYVIGDDREAVVKLSNFVNSSGDTALMSENVPSNYTELVDDLLDDKNHDFDLTVAISKQPIEASIEADRDSKFRAVVCRNLQEAAKARKARTNVIVLDCNDLEDDDAANIVEAWVKAKPSSADEATTAKQTGHTDTAKHLFSFMDQKSVPKKRKIEHVEKEPEEEPEEDLQKPKGKGIIKNIKYTFGLE